MPALVTVNVEPRSSSGGSVPARAASASRCTSASSSSTEARVAAAHDGDDEALLGLDGDAEVVAVEVARSRRRSSRAFSSGNSRSESAVALSASGTRSVEVDAGEVALLDEGDRGHLAVRARRRARRSAGGRRAAGSRAPSAGCRAGRGRAHVLLGDPPAGAGAGDRRQGRRRAPARSCGRAASPAPRPSGSMRHDGAAGCEPARRRSAARLLADHHEHACRPGRPRPRATRILAPCPPPATGSRPSSCRSGSRRAGRPRRSPGPPRRASARPRPR